MTTSKSILSRLALAAALVAGFVAASPLFESGVQASDLNRKLSAPVHDAGDPDIRNMPVVRSGGNYQRR